VAYTPHRRTAALCFDLQTDVAACARVFFVEAIYTPSS
jgi:hypothetical protein